MSIVVVDIVIVVDFRQVLKQNKGDFNTKCPPNICPPAYKPPEYKPTRNKVMRKIQVQLLNLSKTGIYVNRNRSKRYQDGFRQVLKQNRDDFGLKKQLV